MWLGPRPSDSQFTVQTVQIDTDYRHMICLGFAPVHIEIFFLFVLYFFSTPPSTDGLHDMVVVGWSVSVSWHHPTWTPHSADLQAAGC